MAIIDWKKDETIAVVTMNNGENRHNLTFAQTLLGILDDIEADETVNGVVIASSDEKNWSQGIDLGWMMERIQAKDMQSTKDFVYTMDTVFKKILLYPMPVIAAINGHAVANGAILSLACDFRFMTSDRGFFFFPEIDIDIPFLPGMLAFIQKAIPLYKFEEMLFSGKRYTATELEADNIIRKACDNKDVLMQEAVTFAKSFQKKRWIFGEMKKRLHKGMIEVIENEDPPYIESTRFGD